MKSHLTKITICALGLACAGIARADQAAAATAKPAEAPAAAPAVAAAPEPTKDWSVTVGADYFSEYIFRGVDFLANDPVFVPSVVAKYKGLTAYYYGYYGDSDSKPNKWYEETDLGADWTQTLLDGKLALTAGGLYYVYFDGNSGKDTWELYGKVAWNDGFLNPYIAINWDIDSGAGLSGLKGGYGVVGVNHSFDLSKALNLKDGMSLAIVPSAQLGIDFGYNSSQTQANINWNDVLFGVTVPFNLTPAFNIHAGFQWSLALNSLHDIGQHNEAIANVGASFAF